jgi:UDP-3-O-[3-hydroxymyristoyl] glucosamine N-acyltransferase
MSLFFAEQKFIQRQELVTIVQIHSGAIIGADGFGFAPNADGTFKNPK